jgi:hypothetical protein
MPMSPRLLRPVAAGGFNPTRLAGLIGWYDSADLASMAQNADGTGAVAAGDQVGYWKDKSLTAAHVTQSIAANRPTLTASAVNGRAALVFDGSNDTLSRSSYTAQSSLAGLTRIAVFSSSSTFQMMSRCNPDSSDEAFYKVGGATFRSTVSVTNGVSTTDLGASVPLAVYASVFDGAGPSMTLLQNNATLTTSAVGTLPATTGSGTSTLWIGSNVGANLFNNGPIAEYIIYNRGLLSTEVTAVYEYLRKKWGFV